MASLFSRLVGRLRQVFSLHERGTGIQSFSAESDLVESLTRIARNQHRDKQKVLDEILKAGLGEVLRHADNAAKWDSLSPREQEVLALICLGQSSFEIAEILSISYDTVRSHSKHIYAKFGLGRKELRQALRGWNFADWWESHSR